MDHFHLLAPFYDRLIPIHPIHIWHEQLKLSPDMNLLDVGGGTGRIGSELVPAVRQVILADVSLNMIKQAHRDEKLLAVCTESELISIGDNVFDRIIMIDAFHHVRNQQVTANELYRILKPGGRILIIEPDIEKFDVKLLALFEKFMFMRSHFCRADELLALFNSGVPSMKIYRQKSNYCFVVEK